MWYLNAYTIVSLLGAAAVLAILSAWAGSFGQALRKPVLLLFSLVFLAVYSQKLAVFSVLYVLVNFALYRLVLHAPDRLRKPAFGGAIAANLAVLLVLRLFAEGVLTHPLFAVVLTLGLIYTLLKVINTFYYALYVADKPGPSLVEYACYLLFIPTFTSGPLMKFHDFVQDLRAPFRLTAEGLERSVKRIILGLFKKLVLAGLLLLVYEDLLAGDGALTPWASAAVLLVFYVLLFFDFSGYSDIAIGFGGLMGVRVPENFKRPFSSPTLTQFWRNWHATLGDWFREHIFMVWAGRARSRLASASVALIVMLLVGLWHGIQPLFLLWGLYHGLLLFIETALRQTTVNRRKVSRAVFWARCLVVNVLVGFGTIFFSENIDTASRIWQGLWAW